MKITLPVANQQTLTFSSFDRLAEHFNILANGYLKKDQPRAEAYAIVAWQLSSSNGFTVTADDAPVANNKMLQISYCSAGPVSDSYSSGMLRIHEDQLVQWLFERLSSGKPLLITDMNSM